MRGLDMEAKKMTARRFLLLTTNGLKYGEGRPFSSLLVSALNHSATRQKWRPWLIEEYARLEAALALFRLIHTEGEPEQFNKEALAVLDDLFSVVNAFGRLYLEADNGPLAIHRLTTAPALVPASNFYRPLSAAISRLLCLGDVVTVDSAQQVQTLAKSALEKFHSLTELMLWGIHNGKGHDLAYSVFCLLADGVAACQLLDRIGKQLAGIATDRADIV